MCMAQNNGMDQIPHKCMDHGMDRFFFSPGPGIAGHLRGECCHVRSPREQVGRTCFSGVFSPLQRSKEDTTTNKTFNLSDLDLKAPAMSGHPRGHPCKSQASRQSRSHETSRPHC